MLAAAFSCVCDTPIRTLYALINKSSNMNGLGKNSIDEKMTVRIYPFFQRIRNKLYATSFFFKICFTFLNVTNLFGRTV